MLLIANRKLSRMNANSQASRASRRIVPQQGALTAFIKRAIRRERQWNGGNHHPATQGLSVRLH
jgi:hypothetical protein